MKTVNLEHSFYGRAATLELLKKRVVDLKDGYRQNVAFLGSRYVGKTSILRQFIEECEEEGVIPVYLDLDNRDFYYLFHQFAGGLLHHFCKAQHIPVYDDLKFLMESTRRFIPKTVEAIRRIEAILVKEKWEEAYREIIALPDTFVLETNKFCVIILDEFHNLENIGVDNVFQELGKKIMTQKRCLYVVASSSPVSAKKILSEKLSLLFGNFEIVPVAAFDLKTSQGFIEGQLSGINIGGQFRSFLTDFTGGHPLYLNLLCQEIIRLSAIHEQKWVFLPLIIQAIENSIFHEWGVLNRHFGLVVDGLCQDKGSFIMSSVLLSLSNGKNKLAELVSDVGFKQAMVLQRVNRLIEAGIVVKNGNFYLLEDKLLRYWIKFVYGKRLRAFDFSEDRLRKQFQDELNKSLAYYNQISREDLSSRIVDLFHCFDDEALQLNGRKYKLAAFTEVVPIKLRDASGKYFEVIKASGEEGTWLVILKNELLAESDLNGFLTELKKLEEKPQRRVIVSLSDLDANARLKALQERMWIWNEIELNSLLSIYDKPFIVK